ncbi:MAG: ATP-binding protein, partial [Desulfobacteraceae bacterium]|nr:ATP-binding protein [Desulfobacteraceae bacterium]
MPDDSNVEIAEPHAGAMIESLRAFGYDLRTATADLIDNSVFAEAKNVWIYFHWNGADSFIRITDDGWGMSEGDLYEAMRPGSKSPLELRKPSDLGRFGLGMKTASFSQCRRLTVVS